MEGGNHGFAGDDKRLGNEHPEGDDNKEGDGDKLHDFPQILTPSFFHGASLLFFV